MISSAEYPKLRNFIACAFHQDWEGVADTVQGVVDADVKDEAEVYLQRVAAEATSLLASPNTNEELADWLTRVGCCVIIEGQGYSPRSFIAMIVERIRVRFPTTR